MALLQSSPVEARVFHILWDLMLQNFAQGKTWKFYWPDGFFLFVFFFLGNFVHIMCEASWVFALLRWFSWMSVKNMHILHIWFSRYRRSREYLPAVSAVLSSGANPIHSLPSSSLILLLTILQNNRYYLLSCRRCWSFFVSVWWVLCLSYKYQWS